MTTYVLIGLGFIGLIFAFFVLGSFRLWIQSIVSSAPVSLISIVLMPIRKINPSLIVNNYIVSKKAGLNLSVDQLETHYLAQGNVTRVVHALVEANKANIELDFQKATAIDLAGRDILDAINTSVNPKVIDVPKEGTKNNIDAVAKDGIQLRVRARVTVRTYLPRLIGGATEETIIARVGEGIVSAIGSAPTHAAVLENPDLISKTVLSKQLDSGTAFEILSIDIADVDVGENIGAKLQGDQAEADKVVAQAQAEKRRAMAVAEEQEMKARVVENQAKVVEAEAQIPQAIADAFRNGNLGVMDYYNLRNIQADTDMRKGLGDQTKEYFMDIIIRAIIAIFKEIFEQDAQRRRPKPASKRPKNLEEILEQLEKGQKPQTQTKSQPRPKPVEWKVQEVFEGVEPPPIYMSGPKIIEPQNVPAPAAKTTKKLLPGNNDLQNLIWAQTILGPCRAKEPFRLKL